MTKVKKIIIGSILSVVTLGGLTAYATFDGCGKFAGMQGKGGDFMIKRVSSRLSLDTEQQLKLENLRNVVKAEIQIKKMNNTQDKVIELISEPKLNQQKALAMIEERSNKMSNSAPKIITAMANFTDSLSLQQRTDLQQMINKMGMHRGKGPFSH